MSRSESPSLEPVMLIAQDAGVLPTQSEGGDVLLRRPAVAWAGDVGTEHHTPEEVDHLLWTFAIVLRRETEAEAAARNLKEQTEAAARNLKEQTEHQRASADGAAQAQAEPEQEQKRASADGAAQAQAEPEQEKQGKAKDPAEEFKTFVLQTCVKIAKAGLQLQVVRRTDTSKHKVILLVRCPEELFIPEFRKLVLRRWRQTGEGLTFRPIIDNDGDGVDDKDGQAGFRGGGLREVVNPTEADRIQLTALILSKEEDRGGCGFGNIEHRGPDDDPRVVSIFPLHNKEWIRRVTAEWKAAFSLRARAAHFRTDTWERMKRICGQVRSCCGGAPVEPDIYAGSVKDHEDSNEHNESARALIRAHRDGLAMGRAVLSRRASMAVHKLAKQLSRPRDVSTAHEQFLTSVCSQYGERFAFLFAFITCCSQSFVVLIYMTLGLSLATMVSKNWTFNLQVSGIVSILIPCVWGPAFLSRWDRMSFWYSNKWGSVGVTSIQAPNPFFRKKPVGQSDAIWVMKKGAVAALSLVAVIVALVAMCCMNLVIMELEVLVQTAPLCGSWFYETVWKDYIAAGGKNASTKINPFSGIVYVVPSCYGGYSEDPWELQVASDWPGTGQWLPRGLMVVCVGAIEGLLIGLVYTEVFTCLALKLVHMHNKPTIQEHEACVINYTYPFELVGFMAYFWVLAFLFIPSANYLQSWLATHEDGVRVPFITTVNMTDVGVVTTEQSLTPTRMIDIWMDDKRFKNQVGPMLLLPALVGLQVPMLFEYLLPAMCVSWQRANRQTQADELRSFATEDSRYGKRCRRCWRWWCTAKCCCSLCRMCRCCVLMCNCCMCDKDRGTSRNLPDPALPDCDDEQLATAITEAIQKFGNDKSLPELQRVVVTCHPQSHEQNDEHILQQQQQQQQERAQQRQDQDGKPADYPGAENTDAKFGILQLHSADDIIVESMLDPLDLPNEYRKVCIIVVLVCMWTGVQSLIPLIGWIVLLIRFKFNFIRLVTYAKRPVPSTPNSSDMTGGYRPWLEGQIFLSTAVTSLLFCLSTGQLEAWWALYDPDQCRPPTLNETRWKFPGCDLLFPKHAGSFRSADQLYDEASSVGALETVDNSIAAPNTSCWQPPIPELNTDCPFAQDNLEEWREKSSRTPEQALHRVVCFVILENVQVILLYAMIKWKQSHNFNIQEKWRLARLAQHSLIADQLFPPETSDKVFSVVGASRVATKFAKKVTTMRSEASATGIRVSACPSARLPVCPFIWLRCCARLPFTPCPGAQEVQNGHQPRARTRLREGSIRGRQWKLHPEKWSRHAAHPWCVGCLQ